MFCLQSACRRRTIQEKISKSFVRLSGRIFHQSQRKVLLKNIFFKDVVQVHDDDGWCSNVCLFTKRRPRTWKITTHRTHNINDANILSDKYIVLQPFVDENEIFVWKVQSRLPYKKKNTYYMRTNPAIVHFYWNLMLCVY